jgi:serine/threonine protein kinase
MQYLYSCGVQHRDLKSHNCLLTKEARAKVSDFGLSRCDALKTATTLTTKNGDGLSGTPAFMAPELLKDNVFTEKSDVYSYAMVLWELFDGGVPWAGHKPLQISFKVVFEHARPPVPPAMPEHLATVLRRAWANDASTRPSFTDIVRHVRADQTQESSTAGEASDDENLRRALAASRLTGAAEERRRAESLAASPPPAPSRARQIEAARRQRYAEPGTTPRRPAAADRTWREGAGSPPALE